MNLITIIIIAIVVWLVYSLINSYRNLEKELREIRAKCIGVNNTTSKDEPTKSTTKTASFTNPKKDIYVPPGKLTPSNTADSSIKTPKNTEKNTETETQTGAYTSTGDQVYSTDSDTYDPYDNDPMSSMKKNLLYGLKSLKTYSAI